MKICAATGNAGKLRELRRILEAQGHEVVSQKELGITIEPEETGTTFAENALIKAETICKASGLPTIADDSGLCVDALDGAPGVYSARYCGHPVCTAPATAATMATTKPTMISSWLPCRRCLPGSGGQSSSRRYALSCRTVGTSPAWASARAASLFRGCAAITALATTRCSSPPTAAWAKRTSAPTPRNAATPS